MPSLSSPEWKQSVPIAALSMVALVPAVCVLWFMTVAMRNERLAVHERLAEVYESHLASVERNITECWNERQSRLHAVQGTPSEIFASIIRSNLADSVLVYGSSNGVRYPAPMKTSLPDLVEEGNGWKGMKEKERL